jgi:hypothetical protein
MKLKLVKATTQQFDWACDLVRFTAKHPIEFTSDVQFTGTSNTQPWNSLVWAIDSSATTAGTTATFQLYNYQTGQYPASGDGYITGTVGTSNVTLSQNITANPTYFRDGSGNWSMKLKLVKATTQQFDWACDLVRFTTINPIEFTSEVEFTGTSGTLNSTQSLVQIDWTAGLSFTTPDVTTTLQLYNYAASQYPTSGDGYITDTIGQTNVTKTQKIITTPTDFTNATGNWAIKIKGTKPTNTSFDLPLDWIEFKETIVASINEIVFNGPIGQVTYELPYTETADTGLFLKGDSRTITNNSGSLMTQLFIRSGAEHPEIVLRYRPTVAFVTVGMENGRPVNAMRIYVIDLSGSDPVSLYGEIPLTISHVSAQIITTNTFNVSYRPTALLITSVLDGTSGSVSVPISSTLEGAIINVEVVQCNIKIARCVM